MAAGHLSPPSTVHFFSHNSPKNLSNPDLTHLKNGDPVHEAPALGGLGRADVRCFIPALQRGCFRIEPTSTNQSHHDNLDSCTRARPLSLALLELCKYPTELYQVHTQLLKSGHHRDKLTLSQLIASHALSGSGDFHYAQLLFNNLHKPNSFIWNTMIRGFIKNSSPNQAILLYYQMLHSTIPSNDLTFPPVLKACSQLRAIEEGKQIHCQVAKLGFVSFGFVQNSLLNMYAACGVMADARQLFDKGDLLDVVSWTSIVVGYARLGMIETALQLFDKMPERNSISWDALIFQCARSGRVEIAKFLLERMPAKTLNSWNSVLFGYAQAGLIEAARDIFNQMPERSEFAYRTLISAYIEDGSLDLAHRLFDQMPRRETPTWNLITAGYTRIGVVKIARNLFNETPEKDVITWNTMIAGYVQNGCFNEAMKLFQDMLITQVKPNNLTLLSILSSCSQLGALDQGKWIHTYIDKKGIRLDEILGTAIIDMYFKCDGTEKALQVFNKMDNKDIGAWNSVISGLGIHGYGEDALELLSEMVKLNLKPSSVTFVGILSACSHAGLVEKGLEYFDLMCKVYKVKPGIEHYGCMVDLFGRAGLVDEALIFIETAPMEPSISMWGALLSACVTHRNLKIGEFAAAKLIELAPDDCGNYVTLSNLYASAGQWDNVVKVRKMMRERRFEKKPGCSMIVVDGVAHEFTAGDTSHPRGEEISSMLAEMGRRLKEAGHVADVSQVRLYVGERDKETELSYHSERLAIAFGLISTVPRSRIYVVKNLRICNDCHVVVKLLSRIYDREIVVRDGNRFHHFRDGLCSCMDYW